MLIAGVDLSLTSTGVCVGSDPERAHSLTITTRLTGPARLAHIRDRVLHYTAGCGLVVVESQAHNASRGVGVIMKTAALHGVIGVALHEWNIASALVNPVRVKQYATGSCRAKKEQMLLAAYKRFGREFANNDECDAFFLAVMGMEACGVPVATVGGGPMPQAHRDALAKVEWPLIAGKP